MANGLLEWFLPNRLAPTFPKFHNLKGIPQERSYLFVCQWLNLEPPYHLGCKLGVVFFGSSRKLPPHSGSADMFVFEEIKLHTNLGVGGDV